MKTLAALLTACLLGLGSLAAIAAEPPVKTIAALYQDKTSLAGKEVSIKGKVVKVNNGVMNKNFLHVQDGSGTPEKQDNDLTVTSQQTAKVGDQVVVSGRVDVNRDFGYGYVYPLLLEEARIAPVR